MKKILFLVLPLTFFISCTSAPKQSNYPPSLQPHMQSAKHWNLLAQSFSMKVVEVLKDRQMPLVAKSSLQGDFGYSFGENEDIKQSSNLDTVSERILYSGRAPVYVDKRDQSVFGKAFRTMLISELWKHDIKVVENPEYAYSLGWECQKIFHENDRNEIFPGIPLLIGSTATYLLVGGDINPKKPHWEVMITLNLRDSKNQLLRETGIKYVNNEDIRHYDNIPDSFIEPVIKPAMTNYIVVGQ